LFRVVAVEESVTIGLLGVGRGGEIMRLETEFRALMPKLTKTEYAKLEQSLIAEGCRDALVTWNDMLIDGYNRYEICTKHNIHFQTIEKSFENREAVANWIIDNQLGRRNLTVEQRNYLIGRKYKEQKQQGKRTDLTSAQNEQKLTPLQNNPFLVSEVNQDRFCNGVTTAERIADEHKVSKETVKRSEKFADAVDVIAQNVGSDGRDEILAREIKVTEKDVIAISKLDAEMQKTVIAEVQSGKNVKKSIKIAKQRQLETHAGLVSKLVNSERVGNAIITNIETEKLVEKGSWWELGHHRLYCGDTAEATFYDKIPQSVFAFADPPYNAGVAEWDVDFVWRHDWLENKADVVAVTPGIASIFDFSRITKMPYRWSIACWIDNGMTRGAMGFGNWIYVALFSTESIYINSQDFVRISIHPVRDLVLDVPPKLEVSNWVQIEDRPRHKGQKPSQLILWLIDKFSQKGDLVIDAFLGSGTTLFACESIGRICYGGDINPKYCADIITHWETMTQKTARKHNARNKSNFTSPKFYQTSI